MVAFFKFGVLRFTDPTRERERGCEKEAGDPRPLPEGKRQGRNVVGSSEIAIYEFYFVFPKDMAATNFEAEAETVFFICFRFAGVHRKVFSPWSKLIRNAERRSISQEDNHQTQSYKPFEPDEKCFFKKPINRVELAALFGSEPRFSSAPPSITKATTSKTTSAPKRFPSKMARRPSSATPATNTFFTLLMRPRQSHYRIGKTAGVCLRYSAATPQGKETQAFSNSFAPSLKIRTSNFPPTSKGTRKSRLFSPTEPHFRRLFYVSKQDHQEEKRGATPKTEAI